MVALEPPELDAVFHALSHPARRGMLHRLAEGECTITGLAEPFSMSFQAASKHVRVLEDAGLVHRTIAGRTHVCRIVPQQLAAADEWLRAYERLWNERFDALEALLKAESAAPADVRRHPPGRTRRRGRRRP